MEKLWPDQLMANYNINLNYPYGNFGNNNMHSNEKKSSYAPKEFKDKISKRNPFYENGVLNDLKELVRFLILTLHEELNRVSKITIDKKYNNKNKKKNEGYNNQIINQQDNSPNNHYLIDINEYNLDSQFQFTKINDCFNIPPLIGLDNIGASCYMNAILQCLCNIPKLVNYFKYIFINLIRN